MEIGVKNDEQLIKVATILQRVFQNQDSGAEGFGISDEEREQLLKEIDNIQNNKNHQNNFRKEIKNNNGQLFKLRTRSCTCSYLR